VFVPRAFRPAGDSIDERFLFLGPLLGDREQRETWSPPPGARVVYLARLDLHRPARPLPVPRRDDDR
jgi:hypothetical protein